MLAKLFLPKRCVGSVCRDALQGVASAAAVFYTFIWFPVNENNTATGHMTTDPFIKQRAFAI